MLIILSLFIIQNIVASKPVNKNYILQQIFAPVFPEKIFSVNDYGAIADGKTDCRNAINNAIIDCSNSGGGQVLILKGKYYVGGAIVLKSNVNLRLEKNAELTFSSVSTDFLPEVLTNWEGTQLYNYSPLIYAYRATNIAITGSGTINGNASSCFAKWRPQRSKLQDQLRQMGIDGVPVEKRLFGKESVLPPSMIQPYECNNILIEGVKIIDSPFWVIHPVYCNNLTVRGVEISSYNLNNDGCDPESTTNVLIENCVFNVGDDAIAIKAGRDNDGWRVGRVSQNIIIRNCEFNSLCNGLCIGSEMSAGVQNVYMENVSIRNCSSGIYFKSNLDRGGFIKNIWVRNIRFDSVRSAFIRFDTDYKGSRGGFYPSKYENFLIENITGNKSEECGFYAVGIKDYPLKNIILKNVVLKEAPIPYILKLAEGVVFDNVRINSQKMDKNPRNTANLSLRTD